MFSLKFLRPSLALALLFIAFPVVAMDARVYFIEPSNGATVKSPFMVRFGVDGMTVAPAGTDTANTGHHHLIIDGAPVPVTEVIPADDSHRHFGKGQTETQLNLPPGDHTLTLQFGDGAHHSFGPALSNTITVHVAP